MINPKGIDQLCRADDIAAHLRYAAAQIRSVELRWAGGSTRAELAASDSSAHGVLVRMPLDAAEPRPGQVVRVRYERGLDRFEFLTCWEQRIAVGVWRLDHPRVVNKMERRSVPRRRVTSRDGFAARLMLPTGTPALFVPLDLSTNGMSLVASRRSPWAKEGTRMEGAIGLPDGSTAPVDLVVRNVRSGGHPGQCIIGLQFVDATHESAQAIALALTALG